MKKIIFVVLLCIVSNSSAYTTINSNIATNTTWTAGTYYISTSIDVNSGIFLTINPGVIVKFAHGTRIYVPGTIDANGSDLSSNYVVFTSIDDNTYGETITGSDGVPNPGDWEGIYGYGEGGHQGTIQLDYTILRYGGNASGPDGNLFWNRGSGYFRNGICEYSATNGINVRDVHVSVENSLIRNNSGNGVYIYENLVNLNINVNNNLFTNNTGYAAHIVVTAFSNINNNSGSGNGVNGFALAGQMNGDQTITGYNSNFPLIMVDQISVAQSNTLTIPASTIIKSETSGYLWVSGTIIVSGQSDNAVVFTSYKDDTYGGDTYNDGPASTPVAGDWKGILVTNDGNYSTTGGVGTFNYAIIRYGGNSSTSFDANVGITVSAFTSTFTGCVIENSANYGIYVSQAFLKLRSSRIINNGTYGVFGVSGYYSGGINLGDYSADDGNNRLTGNGTGAIYNNGYTILAEANYWGVTTDGEISALITNETGSVDYTPWLDSDPSSVPTPVELASFSAKANNNSVELNWTTATEVNNYGFSVERKLLVENREWEEIGFVEGHGNSNSPKEYSFIDADNLSGTIQYRLKQIDIDGTFEYSETIEVAIDLNTGFKLSQNYPNPFNPTTKIKYEIGDKSFVTLKVYNSIGQEVATLVNKQQAPGSYEVEFNASVNRKMSSGIYIYQIKSGQFEATKKLVLLK
ncbi:MAG: T9SS type A sorting domain-containing protein [Bacteroidetes bacterium]|nr:T9SS type A sorting domain-containing protein [Bacteroidota bacterium]MBU1114565.1 T9SS type A sorting domain-containing protein [Bacteroidota bacterium]MBU1800248.1 T9SS type A sorting domain-containing protein [Bacteroidota bacterium]